MLQENFKNESLDKRRAMINDKEPCDYNHLILYAKGWYKHGNVIEDVRKILANRACMEPEYVSDADVWGCCLSALLKYSNSRQIELFLSELFKPNHDEGKPFTWFEPNCPLDRAVKRILVVLMQLTVRGQGEQELNLGEPNPSILPLRDRNT